MPLSEQKNSSPSTGELERGRISEVFAVGLVSGGGLKGFHRVRQSWDTGTRSDEERGAHVEALAGRISWLLLVVAQSLCWCIQDV